MTSVSIHNGGIASDKGGELNEIDRPGDEMFDEESSRLIDEAEGTVGFESAVVSAVRKSLGRGVVYVPGGVPFDAPRNLGWDPEGFRRYQSVVRSLLEYQYAEMADESPEDSGIGEGVQVESMLSVSSTEERIAKELTDGEITESEAE